MITASLRAPALLAALTLSLSGCIGSQGRDLPDLGTLRDTFGLGGAETLGPSALDLARATTPQSMAALGSDLLIVEVPALGLATRMVPVGTTGGVTSWQDDAGRHEVALSQSGVLRSTRGMVADLMSSDTGMTEAALAARRPGNVARVMVHLDGELRDSPERHLCEIARQGDATLTLAGRSYATAIFRETCLAEDDSAYVNRYWIDADGMIRQSLQWISPEIGEVRMARFSP